MQETIVVAGASGFIGRHVCRRLAEGGHRVIALSRSGRLPVDHPLVDARPCDLFSLLDAERGVAGATQAVYLIHSMLPTARLTQASFEDMDLVLADNFARACRGAGVAHAVYLGGLMPSMPSGGVSAHLSSRREVEDALAAYGMTVTALRAGLVIGPQGSSFRIVERLVERLPVMLCPTWTRTPTQPVALSDVVEIVARTLETPAAQGGARDIGSPDVVTYVELMRRTAEQLRGEVPEMRSVPVLTPRLSALWVSLVTGTPMALVKPLVQSLKHPMLARDLAHQEALGIEALGVDAAIAKALAGKQTARPRAAPAAAPAAPAPAPAPPDGRSIQRLPHPGRDAAWVAEEYLQWLPKSMPALIAVEVEGDRAKFVARPTGTVLLELTLSRERSTADRTLLYITGGRLARRGGRRGRLEFRSLDDVDAVLAAIHDYEPSLPWWLYKATQAPMHLWVMWRFGRHLGRLRRRAQTARDGAEARGSQAA